ncbi:MAG: peptidoglycan-binding protein [Clostridia bacterium]|nr:peptidoglycan-binding protein [Clostridia bacterium]
MKFKDRVKTFLGDLHDGISCRIEMALKFAQKNLKLVCVCACALVVTVVLLCIFIPKLSRAIDKAISARANSVTVPSAPPDATPTATAIPTPEPPPTPSPEPLLLKKGDTNDIVLDIQQRLMELNYMDYDEPTNFYGPITTDSIKVFQRRNGLEVTGETDMACYSLLMSSAAKVYMASIGDEGTDIKEMQKRLYELDYLKSSALTGYFGEETEAAVREFQKRNHIEVDGMVGTETKELLYSEDAIAFSLYIGSTGDDVKMYQRTLYRLGYLNTEPDGVYGRDTVNAVKRFQERNDIIVDGHIGPTTKTMLLSSSAKYNKLVLTMSGDDVLRVQQRLYELNYLKKSEVTSYYGSVTDLAVRVFQKKNGLSQDGAVGKNTMAKLFSSSPVKASRPVSTDPAYAGQSGSGVNTSGMTPAQKIEVLITVAKSKLGCKYVRGAKGPNTFDCSGFVYWCLKQAGAKSVSYMTSYQWRTTTRYRRISSMSSIKRGDVIVYKMSATAGHVAIALGDGMMIDASSRNGKVVIRTYQTSYWRGCFVCAYRIFE